MPNRAHSIASTRIRFSTAARAALVCAIPGRPLCGEIVTLMIRPPPAGIIARVATAWVISHVPSTFSRMTVRKPFGVICSAGERNWPPALLTSTSMRPCCSSTASTSRSTCVLLADVARLRVDARVRVEPAVSASGSARRPQTTTRAPRRESSSAVARPIPIPPPLTSAT